MQSATQDSEAWVPLCLSTEQTDLSSFLHPCFCFACYCSEGTIDCDGEQELDNPVIHCKYCSIQVHVKCVHRKGTNTPFVCDSCSFLREDVDPNLLHCMFCSVRFGYLYRCKNETENPLAPPSFIHLWCALFHMGATISSFVTYRISATNPVDSLAGVPVSSVVPLRQTLVQFKKRDTTVVEGSYDLESPNPIEKQSYQTVSIPYNEAYGDKTLFACSGIHTVQVPQVLQAFHCFAQPTLNEQEEALRHILSPSDQAKYKCTDFILLSFQAIIPSCPATQTAGNRECRLWFKSFHVDPVPGGLCCICKLPVGNTRRCSQQGCKFSFHVTCLWYSGGDITIQLQEHEYVSSGIQPKLIAFCPLHTQVRIHILFSRRTLVLKLFHMCIQETSVVLSLLLVVSFLLILFPLRRLVVTFVDTLLILLLQHSPLISHTTVIMCSIISSFQMVEDRDGNASSVILLFMKLV